MEIIGHAILDCVVSEDDGPNVVRVAAADIQEWLAGLDLRVGDEVVVVRGARDDEDEA